MKRRLLLFVSILLTSAPALHAADSRPNIVVIIADDMAWNDCGAYGHAKIRTPNIDRLAEEGMRFTSAFLTCSSCSPSRCSINTGRYPHATGAPELHMPLPKSAVLFSSCLRKAGYYTAACGKWHMGAAVESQYDVVRHGGNPAGYGHWLPTLKNRPKDKPFFLWLATTDPHRPYQKDTIEKPHGPADAEVPPYMADVPETRGDLAMYYDEIGRLDLYVGRVMEELKRQGVDENTLVLFMSDNGRPFPRCKTTVYDSGVKTPFIVRYPQCVKAGTVCDSLVSAVDIAPTFCAMAGAKPSSTFQGVSFAPLLSDPTATVRHYVFSEHNWHDYKAFERSVRGKHFLYIENGVPDVPCTPPADAVRSPTHQAMIRLHEAGKLSNVQETCFQTPAEVEKLFDVVNDPHQLKNLAKDPQYAKTLARMKNVLAAWQEETADAMPKKLTPDKFDRRTGERLKK